MTPAEQALLDEAEEQISAIQNDIGAEGMDVDACWSDIVDAASWGLTGDVRKEFYRRQGVMDRQTGYDPLEDV